MRDEYLPWLQTGANRCFPQEADGEGQGEAPEGRSGRSPPGCVALSLNPIHSVLGPSGPGRAQLYLGNGSSLIAHPMIMKASTLKGFGGPLFL